MYHLTTMVVQRALNQNHKMETVAYSALGVSGALEGHRSQRKEYSKRSRKGCRFARLRTKKT